MSDVYWSGVVSHRSDPGETPAQIFTVEPGSVGGGEVEAPAWMGFQPRVHVRGLVHLQVVEEGDELEPAVALVDAALDLARVHEQGGQQGDGAVPLVLELSPFGPPRRS